MNSKDKDEWMKQDKRNIYNNHHFLRESERKILERASRKIFGMSGVMYMTLKSEFQIF